MTRIARLFRRRSAQARARIRARAQLTRLRDADIKLTVCVEQVAASGGYMMACCADRLVASPFAVLGSIGVISEIPNLYERLKNSHKIKVYAISHCNNHLVDIPDEEDEKEERRQENSRVRFSLQKLPDDFKI